MHDTLSMDQVFVNKLTEIVHSHLGDENFGIETLVREAGMSRSKIQRKLRAITNQSVSQFIREIRLKKARQMLQENLGTVSEIAYKVGFGSPTYFSKCFHDFFGFAPVEVKNMDSEISDSEVQNRPLRQDITFKKSIRKAKLIPSLIFSGLVVISLLAVFVIDSFNLLRNDDDIIDANGKIPITIFQFQNITNDTVLDLWQDWIKDNLVSNLTNYPEALTVRQEESFFNPTKSNSSSNYASINSSVAKSISKRLTANVFISGSIKQAGDRLQISAHLVNAKTGVTLKFFQVEGIPSVDETKMIYSLSVNIIDYLIISKLKKEEPYYFKYSITTTSSEAYGYYVYGKNAFIEREWKNAIKLFQQAIKIDTNFTMAKIMLSITYGNSGSYALAKESSLKAYKESGQVSPLLQFGLDYTKAVYNETPREEIEAIKNVIFIDDQDGAYYYSLGLAYTKLFDYENTIKACEMSLKMYEQRGIKPPWISFYTVLGKALHESGQYRKERKLYRKAERDFPESQSLIFRQSVLALSDGKIYQARKYIEKYISVRRSSSSNEPGIAKGLGDIYADAGIIDSAETYYRKSIALERNVFRLNALAWFLIDNEIDIEEGLELANEALEFSPDIPGYLHTKAWGLYKQKKYQEALEILSKCISLIPVYNHRFYLDLEKVKAAVALSER